MEINGLYFLKKELYEKIKEIGGKWNDKKERPFVLLLKIDDNSDIYWAIPLGNYNHRDEKAKKRLEKYVNLDENNIKSNYYHIGRTDKRTVFLISKALPITEKYIDREYLVINNTHYIIKNKRLLSELERKLKRILFYESKRPNFFEQHITDMKNTLLEEINK